MRMLLRFFAPFLAMISLLGTAKLSDTPPPIPPANVLAQYLERGQGQVRGRVVAQTRLFGTLAFANVHVNLIPWLDYTYWYVKISGDDMDKASMIKREYPAQLRQYTRHTTSAADGSFQFDNVPAGDYIINAAVTKEEASRPLVRRSTWGTDINGDAISVPIDVPGLKIKAEGDFLAATVKLPPGRTAMIVDSFDVTGSHTCCKTAIDR